MTEDGSIYGPQRRRARAPGGPADGGGCFTETTAVVDDYENEEGRGAAVAAVIERERGGRGERGGLDRRRRSRPTAAASTLAPYDGDRATAVTRETAAAAAVGSLEDPDAAGAGHSFPVGTMSSKDARHPSLSLSLSPPSLPSPQFHFTFRPEIVSHRAARV